MNTSIASAPTVEEVAVFAYLIWEQAGCPQGRDRAHWLQAEKQLRVAALLEQSGRVSPAEFSAIRPLPVVPGSVSEWQEVAA